MDENRIHCKFHMSIWLHVRVDVPISKPTKVASCLSEFQITPDMKLLGVE